MHTATTHAWFDISAGVAGDMLLGACIDAGADLAQIQRAVQAVAGSAVTLRAEPVTRCGQRATKVRVEVHGENPPHRTWRSIRAVLKSADLAPRTRRDALAAFQVLADAEARVHGTNPEDVHFHEVGALDSIADVVGTCEALRLLGVAGLSAGPVALGEGRIRAAHGDIPVPAPATAELAVGWRVRTAPAAVVAHDAATPHHHQHQHDDDAAHHPHSDHDEYGTGVHTHLAPDGTTWTHSHGALPHDEPAPVTTPGSLGELATPTGLALIRALAAACEPMPGLALRGVGVGAGGKDFPGHPNVVRLFLGAPEAAAAPQQEDATPVGVAELQANIDDMDPRLLPGVLDALLAAGAVDAWLAPIIMKKGRPAHTLHALVPPAAQAAVTDAMLRHTTTLGVRSTALHRAVLARSFTSVPLQGHALTVKVGHRDGRVVHAAPEFESVASLAGHLHLTELEVLTRAQALIVEAGLVPGAPAPASAAPQGT